MNNFIISGKGFLRSISFDEETGEQVIKWTQQLRDANKYKTKTATKIIEKFNLDAFIWNPYKEEPKRKWEITQSHILQIPCYKSVKIKRYESIYKFFTESK